MDGEGRGDPALSWDTIVGLGAAAMQVLDLLHRILTLVVFFLILFVLLCWMRDNLGKWLP